MRIPLPTITSFRDYMVFEQHVRTARARRGAEVPPEWYEGPTFYFSNVATLLGDGDEVRKPGYTERLDFELELGIVIGDGGQDIPVEEAERHIAGLTIINDWSARDVQRREMAVGLGPCKGKDFATSVGPHLIPLDDLADRQVAPGLWDLEMTALINGRQVSRGTAADMRWSFCDLIAHASQSSRLLPGDLIGSGTVGTGCLLELGQDETQGGHRWLEPGDEVTLRVEGIGSLSNRIS